MQVFGVFMCDLVGSKDMAAAERVRASEEIRAAVRRLQERFPSVLGNAFEFRFGDEWQLLVDRPEQVYTVYSHLYYLLGKYEFYCGIGLGSVTLPVSANTHEVDGPAFHLAREALSAAKAGRHQMVTFRLPPHERTESAELVLHSLVGMVTRLRQGRRDTQQEACRLAITEGLPALKIAEALGISRSAASYRLSTAGLKDETNALRAVEDLLTWFVTDYSTALQSAPL